MNPMSPSHISEEEHVLSCWGESFHFPERFATRKIFLFLEDLWVTASSVPYRVSWCRASRLKGFQGRGVRGFFTFFSLTRVGAEQLFIHAGLSGMMRLWHFPLAALLLQIQAERLSEPNICCCLPQPGTTHPGSSEIPEQSHRDSPPLIYKVFSISNTCEPDGRIQTCPHNHV